MGIDYWRSKKVIFLLLICLLLIDFFIIGRIDSKSNLHIGYGYNYPLGANEQSLLYQHYGWPRLIYNFSHFFQFWQSPPPDKTFHNLLGFLSLDIPPSTIIFNVLHFFAFAIFVFLLLYFLHLPIGLVFLIGMFFNIFHEYIAEGIYVDPSFNDLWTDTIGLLVGLLAYELATNFKIRINSNKIRK
jgi:hypothetical protein